MRQLYEDCSPRGLDLRSPTAPRSELSLVEVWEEPLDEPVEGLTELWVVLGPALTRVES